MTYAERMKLNRLFQIREQIKKLNEERNNLILEVGYGIHRSKDFPGWKLKVCKAGWRTGVSWAYVAKLLAYKLGWDENKLHALAKENRTGHRRSKHVSIIRDTCRHPRILPI